MKVTSLAMLCVTVFVSQAHASSSEAWAANDKAVLESCIKASGLKDAKPVGTPAQFDDRVGYTALLMQGQYPHHQAAHPPAGRACVRVRRSGPPTPGCAAAHR